MDYIIPYDKPVGLTSFSALGTIKRALGTRKVGHTGTLDKFASGLLIVCTGRLTRLVSHITLLDKTYIATIRFGRETDTLDTEGVVIKTAPLPTISAVINAIDNFKGEITQTPPAYSAIHIAGRRASDIARSGEVVKIPARAVTIFNSEIVSVKTVNDDKNNREDNGAIYENKSNSATGGDSEKSTALKKPIKDLINNENSLVESATVVFHVSKGTYIRSLARDIGEYTKSCAYLTDLRRTQVGRFTIDMAAKENNIIEKALTVDAAAHLIGIKADEAKRICKINDGE